MLDQINLVVRDMAATLDFYRRVGLEFDAEAGATSLHAEASTPKGVTIEFDTMRAAKSWDGGFGGTTGGSTVLGFSLPSRDAVDALYDELTKAGYRGRQRPFDAFWGARYAIVDDPDGNGAGLMSPIDAQRKYWPPKPPP